jgi:hypothetical protein
VNLIETLERRFGAVPGGKLPGTEVDEMVKVAVLEAFHKTDSDFLTKGNVDAGSTANTVLIMGRRVYSCNVSSSPSPPLEQVLYFRVALCSSL